MNDQMINGLTIIVLNSMNYFSNLGLKTVTDNKLFRNSIKPFFSDKGVRNQKITLIIVTRNGKIWKHGPNWSFYALMLRTKLY